MWLTDSLSRALSAAFLADTETIKPRRSQVRKRFGSFEQLESRILMTVSQDANGWTVVTPSADSRIVYVSNSTGNDSNNGLTPETAKKTISAGMSLLRAGMPDHLLLKRGDVFTNQTLDGLKNGRNSNEPIYVGTFGVGERPQVLTGSSTVYDGAANSVVIQGLYFRPHTRTLNNGNIGLALYVSGSNRVILEDCYITEFTSNLIVSGGQNVQIRRNIITDAYGPSSLFTTGMYSESSVNLLLEENVFDHNGWNENVSGAVGTVFNHNVYFDALTNGVTVRNNVFSRSPSSSLKILEQNGNVVVTGNLFAHNGYDAELGAYGGQGEYPLNGSITLTFENNVSVEGSGEAGANSGWGFLLRRIASGSFSNNIIANRIGTAGVPVVMLEKVDWGPGVKNVTLQSNTFYNTRGQIIVQQGANSGNKFINNTFQEPNLTTANDPPFIIDAATTSASVVTFSGGKYDRGGTTAAWFWNGSSNQTFAQWKSAVEPTAVQSKVQFFDPMRTTATYAASLGVTNYNSFMAEMRKQSSTNWRTEYLASTVVSYIRQGFTLDPIGVDPLPSPQTGQPVIAPPPPVQMGEPDSGAGSAIDQGSTIGATAANVETTTVNSIQIVSAGGATNQVTRGGQIDSRSQLLLARRSQGRAFASQVNHKGASNGAIGKNEIEGAAESETEPIQNQGSLATLARESFFARFSGSRRRR